MGVGRGGAQLPFPQEGTSWRHNWSKEAIDCNREEAVAAKAGDGWSGCSSRPPSPSGLQALPSPVFLPISCLPYQLSLYGF